MATIKQKRRSLIVIDSVKIIQSSRNYNIIQIDNDIICFSYKKPICDYNIETQRFVKFNKNIITETNKKHFAYFLKYLQKTIDKLK